SAASVRNSITGQSLAMSGKPERTSGRKEKALEFDRAGTSIDTGHLDLYRKPFTVAAWIFIKQFGENGEVALFGGRAPMGADRDITGTWLRAGIRAKKLFMSF